MPIGQTYTMGKFAHEWLKHELSSELGRKVETLLSGVGNLKTGSVLGKVTVAGASSAARRCRHMSHFRTIPSAALYCGTS